MSAKVVSDWFYDGTGMNSISLQVVASHILVHASLDHTVLHFPAATLMLRRACSEKRCRERRRFRTGAPVVTVECNVRWSSASARLVRARHCLFRRMFGVVIPATTGSMIGDCCLVLRRVGVCGLCSTTLTNNTRSAQKLMQLLIFEKHRNRLPILCRLVVEVRCPLR